jgi:hypothetical protein
LPGAPTLRFAAKQPKHKRFRSQNHEAFSFFCIAMSNVRASVQAHSASASAVNVQPVGQLGPPAAQQSRPENFQVVRFRNAAAQAVPAPPASFESRCARWFADSFDGCFSHPSRRLYVIALLLLVLLPKVLGVLCGAFVSKILYSSAIFFSVVFAGACVTC